MKKTKSAALVIATALVLAGCASTQTDGSCTYRCSERTERAYSANQKTTEKVRYDYDDEGRIISEEYVGSFGSTEKLRLTEFLPKGGSISTTTRDGVKVLEQTYSADGTCILETEYDSDGEVVANTAYWQNGALRNAVYGQGNEFGIQTANYTDDDRFEVAADCVRHYRKDIITDEEYLCRETLIDLENMSSATTAYNADKTVSAVESREYFPDKRLRKYSQTCYNDYENGIKHTEFFAEYDYSNTPSGEEIISERTAFNEDGSVHYTCKITCNTEKTVKCPSNSIILFAYDKTAEKTYEDGRTTIETNVVDDFGNIVGREITDKATGEKLAQTSVTEKKDFIRYVTKDNENNLTEITTVDKNGNVTEYECGLDLNGKKTHNYKKITMKYKAFEETKK